MAWERIMQFRIGSVYRDLETKVDFVAVQKSHEEEKNVLVFQLVNINNMIVLEEYDGRLLSSGEISCAALIAEQYECVAKSFAEYYNSDKAHKKKPK